MYNFIQPLKQQYPPEDGYVIDSSDFQFKRQDGSDQKLEIHFNRHPPGEWQLELVSQKSKVPKRINAITLDCCLVQLVHSLTFNLTVVY